MSQLLEVGTHRVTVRNVQFTAGSPGKTDQMSIRFEDDMGDGITWYSTCGWKKDGSYSQEAGRIFLEQMAILGWDAQANDWDLEKLGQPDVSPIMRAKCEIVVEDETYNGKTSRRVRYINDPNRPRPGAERMAPAAAQSFAERTRNAMRSAGFPVSAVRAPAPKPALAVKPPINEPFDPDSIPFLWLLPFLALFPVI